MKLIDLVLPEFDQEMATTRKLLERVPTDKGEWKPHPKSFSMGHLAQLISMMPGWITKVITDTELNVVGGPGYSYEATEALVASFDRNVREAREALVAAAESDFDVSWSLKAGETVLFTETRRTVLWQTINHLVHHRGQLSVYLRMVEVPLPSIYGPTADEPWGKA
ncbi:MAG TPA: DinB family protein [Candidatus Eisenbacteria bacterium]